MSQDVGFSVDFCPEDGSKTGMVPYKKVESDEVGAWGWWIADGQLLRAPPCMADPCIVETDEQVTRSRPHVAL